MAFSNLDAMRRALQKARDKGEMEEPGEIEPRRSNPKMEAAEEKREKS